MMDNMDNNNRQPAPQGQPIQPTPQNYANVPPQGYPYVQPVQNPRPVPQGYPGYTVPQYGQYYTPPQYAPVPYQPAQNVPAQNVPAQNASVQNPVPMAAQPYPQGQTPQMQQPTGPQFERIDKRVLRQCRHKSELRWYWFLAILNLVIIVGVVAYFVSSMQENTEYADDVYSAYLETLDDSESAETEDTSDSKTDSSDEAEDDEDKTAMDKLEEKIQDTPENLDYLLTILFTIIAIPFVVSYAYAQYRSMSIQITENTYPEIYAIVQEFSQKMGFKKVPKVYLIQGNGVLNAFSSFIPFKQYIELYADLVEVAYREHHDMDTLRFIIGHEMGHIYYKHATMHNYYSIMFSQMIPILGSTLSRAREYSCDRLAQLLSGSDGVDAMMSLTAGIHLYKQVDKQDYINHAAQVRGLFVFCYNLVCDHPVTTKRVLALVDPQRRSGKLY